MQRTILILGQGTNTAWSSQAANTSFYGVVQGPFFQDAGFTNTTGNANGAYAECAFACVLSRMFHSLGPVAAGHPTLTTNVNVAGQIAASSAFKAGAGNLSVVTVPQTLTNPSYWYDATDLDAITAGQKIGFMQSVTANANGAVNPSLGVTCDSVNAGFCSPFMFPMQGVGTGSTYLTGPYYTHLGGNSGSVASAGFTFTISLAQDYCPGSFVASWLQWQPFYPGTADTKGLTTATFTSSATVGAVTPSSLSVKISGAGALGIQHDVTDIVAVPAGYYACMQWTGAVDSGTMRIGNAGVHIRPTGNNATLLVTGCKDTSGLGWTGGAPAPAGTTYTTFGAPRDDKLYTENMVSVPTAGVFANLSFQTGSQAYGGTPATFTLQNGPNSGDTGAGSGTISTNSGANFVNTSLAVTASASSTWYVDRTDIAAFTPYSGMMLALYSAAGGSGNATTPLSVTMQAYAVNFTAPAHLGMTTVGAG